MADELSVWSGGQIKVRALTRVLIALIVQTGVYHAAVTDHEKESIHTKWRAGKIK